MISRFLITLAITILSACSALAVTVTVKSPVEVKPAVMITLGDIAQITGAKADVDKLKNIEAVRAPLAGGSRTVDLQYLKLRIKAVYGDISGIKFDCPASITLVGKSIKVKGEEIAAAAREYLLAQMPDDGLQYEAEVSRIPADVTVGDGKVEFKVDTPGARSTAGPRTVTVSVMVDGRESARVNVFIQVKAFAQVLVARSGIPQNAAVDESNTFWETRDVTRISSPVTRDTDITNFVAARRIQEGSVITTAMLQAPAAIEAGSPVTIVVTSQTIRLTARGKAEQSGRPGETIRVTGPFSNGQLRATVVEPGLVEIRI